MADYISLTNVKTQLGISGTSQDTYLGAIISSVETNINTYLGFDPTETEIVEFIDTRGTAQIYLRRSPITSVDAVYENPMAYYGSPVEDAFEADSLLVDGVDYVWVKDHINCNALLRLKQVWPLLWGRQPTALSSSIIPCPGCVKVEYTVDPTDMLTVCAEAGLLETIARYKATMTGTGIVTSDSMDGASVSVNNWRSNPYNQRPDSREAFISPFVSTMLHPFRPGSSFFIS